MKGEFLRRKSSILDLLFVIGGLLSVGFYVFLKITAPDDAKELLFFLILGIVLCLISALSWLLTSNGYLSVDNHSIKGRYNCFWKIENQLSEVSFASAQGNSLTIQMKNGDFHTIMNMANARQLASFIRKNIPPAETEAPCVLMEKLNELKNARKKSLIYTCLVGVFLFLNIFIAVFLTGGREWSEFGKTDRIIMSIMGAIEFLTFLALFHFARKAGRKMAPIEKMQYTLRKRVMENTALLPGKVIRVFADEDYSERITVFGYPHDNGVYFVEQAWSSDCSLVTVYQSEVYENLAHLPEGFKALTDITEELSVS